MWSGQDKAEFATFLHKEISEATARVRDDRNREIKRAVTSFAIAGIGLGVASAFIAAGLGSPTAAGLAVIPLAGGLALMLVRLML